MKQYSIILQNDAFSHNGWQMYDKYTKQIKTNHVVEWIEANVSEIKVGQEINVPDSTNMKLTYFFRVSHIDEDNIVSLGWIGYEE